jgi:HAD superfamily hydrolase (TIGR01509 family)
MRNPRALIFDCDGVLVNSEEIIQEIELKLLADHGLQYDRDEFSHRFLGVSDEFFYSELSADSMATLGRPLPEAFSETLKKQFLEAFQTDLRCIEGVRETVQSWNGLMAVASSSSISALDHKLRATGLSSLFLPHVYSAEHVGIGKPDPSLYLHTAARLEVETRDCIVIEDSVNGVLAAKAAGMFTVGFVGGAHCREGQDVLLIEAGADLVVQTMNELQQHLRIRRV